MRAACRIAAGSRAAALGNLDIQRDWGWAPEYVDAMWRMLQQADPQDYVIATGRLSLQDFVAEAFGAVGLDWRQHVQQDRALLRPSDIKYGAADATLAHQRLGWAATMDVDRVVAEMCRAAASPGVTDQASI